MLMIRGDYHAISEWNFPRPDSHVRAEDTFADSQDRSCYNMVSGAWRLYCGLQTFHSRYALRAGVCCHSIIISHFHTWDNKLTLSLIHTCVQVRA